MAQRSPSLVRRRCRAEPSPGARASIRTANPAPKGVKVSEIPRGQSRLRQAVLELLIAAGPFAYGRGLARARLNLRGNVTRCLAALDAVDDVAEPAPIDASTDPNAVVHRFLEAGGEIADLQQAVDHARQWQRQERITG